MSESELNMKYIQEKTGLVENDELIPIILDMLNEAYIDGLIQGKFDINMDLFYDLQNYKEKNKNAIEKLEALIVFWKKFNPIDNKMQVEQFKGLIETLKEE